MNVCKLLQRQIFKLKNKKIKIIFTKWPKNYKLIEKRKYILNSNKFKKITKWKEKITIDKGIETTINFFDSMKNSNKS